MVSRCLAIVVLAFVALAPGMAHASVFTAYGVNSETGNTLSATVEFTVSGSNLIVTLSNLGGDVTAPSDILTAVFFDLADNITLTPVSAVLASGSTVLFGSTDSGNSVGGEWAYSNSYSSSGVASEGISSTGLGLFGPSDNFTGSNLQGPAEVDGVQYGITSINDDSTTGNKKVTGSNALIQYSVVFVLSGLPDGFNVDTDITNVSFQYGTSLSETNLPATIEPYSEHTPEPTSLAAWAMVVMGGVWTANRRRQWNAR